MIRQRAGLAAASLGILCPLAWQTPHFSFSLTKSLLNPGREAEEVRIKILLNVPAPCLRPRRRPHVVRVLFWPAPRSPPRAASFADGRVHVPIAVITLSEILICVVSDSQLRPYSSP